MANEEENKFDNSKYEQLLKEHEKVKKRICKKDLSTNELTLKTYERDIVVAYNNFVEYAKTFQAEFDEQSKNLVISEIQTVKEKTQQCAEKLNLTFKFPENIFEPIDHEIPTLPFDLKESASTSAHSETTHTDSNESNESDSTDLDLEPEERDSNNANNSNSQINVPFTRDQYSAQRIPLVSYTMSAKENRDFIKFAAQTINRNYSGDPLTLQAFINTIDLVRATAETGQMDLLKKFVVSRLEGKALECVDPDKSLDDIIADLKASIKVDSSDVIEGRLQALKLSKYGPVEFARQAEALADALQRSLVLEGINLAKAKELTIKKTVEMCKQTAKTDYVKSVLASTPFSDPKSVISKLIVEQNGQERDRQVLTYSRQNSGYRKKRFTPNNGYNEYNGQNSCKPQYNKNYKNNRGGRGGGKGRYQNFNRNNRREYNVRAAENCDAPSGSRREQCNQNGPEFTVERVSRN